MRILRACRELQIESACVFSEEDRGAEYLRLADRAICIGGGAPRQWAASVGAARALRANGTAARAASPCPNRLDYG